LLLTALLAACACASAEDKCEEARALAESSWQAVIDSHEKARKASVAAQGEATTRLAREIQPRFSAPAAQAASARYDRNTDAWQRAFDASRNAMCAQDPECTQLKRENAQAQAAQVELAEKLESERAAHDAVRKTADEMKRLAATAYPDTANAALQAARKASEAAFAACNGLPPTKEPDPSLQ
jgi:hypothetical protein